MDQEQYLNILRQIEKSEMSMFQKGICQLVLDRLDRQPSDDYTFHFSYEDVVSIANGLINTDSVWNAINTFIDDKISEQTQKVFDDFDEIDKTDYTWSDIINLRWLDDVSNGEVFVLMQKKTFADVKDVAQTQIFSLPEAQAWSEKSNEKRIAYVVFGKKPNGEWFTYIGKFGKDDRELHLKPTFIDSINSEPEYTYYNDVLEFISETTKKSSLENENKQELK